MKAIMVMFDSLNRHMLPPYGCGWVHAPNFSRLAQKTVTFDTCFGGSMPCMPARREIHTGRYSLLHRSWGPVEPYDDSMPEILKQNGVYTHLASDHYHYWEEGGATYHTRYNSWQCSRGQEGDPWIGDLNEPEIPPLNPLQPAWRDRQDRVNRAAMRGEKDHPQAKTFAMGLDFIDRNHKQDKWFLHLETFDPHEPYFTDPRYKDLYDFDFSKSLADWPKYGMGHHNELKDRFRYLNAALISMCDHYLGKVLDAMDQYDLWKDTMLIVNTDHGFLLGEHELWAKCVMPFYNEVIHTPLFVWDPRAGKAGERRQSLVQTIDLAPTLLDYFGLAPLPDMQGAPLKETVAADKKVREAGLFGIFGGHVNVTDGRYVYMRAPLSDKEDIFEYTHMPTHMRHTFSVEEMRTMETAGPFSFTKGCRTMKIRHAGAWWNNAHKYGTLLFDNQNDPGQTRPMKNVSIEKRMTELLVQMMNRTDAPPEQFKRLGLG